MADRASALEEMIGEYEAERSVVASRLDSTRIRRATLELARETLEEHGELAEADSLKRQIHDLDHRILGEVENLARLDRTLAVYRSSLSRLQLGES